MTLEPGTRLGTYEIVAAIGAGGMGEVYRARDTKLGRDIAVKVLPEAVANDPERLDRFEREARLLASLNHPNIATLHGLEEAEPVRFLVMELVEGQTLGARIHEGALTVQEALPLLTQVAEGLDAAHEKGVIHRDLKPANIMITPEGRVKILDFGLAKAFAPDDDPDADTSHSPTLTRGTALGAILGTASYMSPEQARGHNVDKRTDIWAFGCCLYEALSGKKAFDGQTVSDIIGSVLKEEPDWTRLPPSARPLVTRCLVKERRARIRDIGDVLLDLPQIGSTPQAAVPEGRHSLRVALAGLVAGVLAAAAVFYPRAAPVTARPTPRRATIMLPEGQTQPRSLYQPLALSPDGSKLVYVAEDETGPNLFLRPMNSFEVQKLAGTRYASIPFFSPDGRSIGFFAAGELKILSLDGGSPVTLAKVRSGLGASWGPNDTIVFSEENDGLFEVPVSGEEPRRLTQPDFGNAGYSHVWPSHLPGNDPRLLFSVFPQGGAILDPETAEWELIPGLAQILGAIPLPTGHFLLSTHRRSPSLLAVATGPELRPVGTPVPVLDAVQYDTYAGRHFAAVSHNGTIVYAASTDADAALQWMSPDGRLTLIRRHEAGIRSPRLSPEGDRVVFLDLRNGIWVLDLRRSTVDRLVPNTLDYGNWNPIWHPDGRISFSSNRLQENWNLYEIRPGGEATELLVREGSQEVQGWTPDGRLLVFTDAQYETGIDLWVLPRGEEPRGLVVTEANEFAPALSPNGRWLAYVSDQSGMYQVYVRAFPDPDAPSLPVSADGGEEPAWSRDGKELFFRRGDGLYAVAVSASRATGIELSAPRLVVRQPFDRNTYRDRAAYDVAADGRFLVVTGTRNTELRVVYDWFEELEALVPTSSPSSSEVGSSR